MMGDALHLCIDARTSEPLTEAYILAFLEHMPSCIGMTPICAPETVETEAGWHGYIIIAESHISVETKDLDVYVDIFSCKPFNHGLAVRLTCDLLGLPRHQTRYHQPIKRGWANMIQ